MFGSGGQSHPFTAVLDDDTRSGWTRCLVTGKLNLSDFVQAT